jgi:hypothetical protein
MGAARWSRKAPAAAPEPRPDLQPVKTRAIDAAFQRWGVRSFADLGGLWAVEGGYTFHALDGHDIERAVLVDTGDPGPVGTHARSYPQLELLRANFGSPDVPGRVGPVDAVLFFDVLLHQVAPDWDEILAMYATVAPCFVIVQPQYTEGAGAVRLLDLGLEEYLRVTPTVAYDEALFADLDAIHPTYGRPVRDIHEIWQWGITDAALEGAMAALGYEAFYFENAGPWQDSELFEAHAWGYHRP